MIKPTTVLKDLYEKIWEDGDACKGCRYYQLETDEHPYGEGVAIETGFVCNMGSNPERCPELQDAIGELRGAIYNANKPKAVR